MPEMVTCPSCGCRVQMSELHLGRRTQCLACNHTFVAAPGLSVPSRAEELGRIPLLPTEAEPLPSGLPIDLRGIDRRRLPLCPSCHRPVGWEVHGCPYCGHEFDQGDDLKARMSRRDGESHRGGTIDTLGTLSLVAGALSLCTGILGLAAALGTGIPAWVMANRDLELMRSDLVDPEGRTSTEFGRNKAIVGIVLGVVLSLFWVLAMWELS